ncbi:hypothetical protein PL75_10025 [Neisseria arctica]|uniref:Uncharacterized protein n=1 Tax=Neisseria arctica TaxID=1470200 RepID=A0A0J1C1B9_9NEIS|nr:hypothetical protein [Neisseria arctica]KLT72073.1 hypothetical protein PL75_10025 [Neisseria arctica]UOO85683.1 hypothetical protein LVJ86_05425 [Neisseria arctica]
MEVPYYEPETEAATEAAEVVSEAAWEQNQDAKAGYVTLNELSCTEQDSRYFGVAKSVVFLEVFDEDMRAWVPNQTDLKPAWDGCMKGSETDFDLTLPDGSFVRVIGSEQKMQAYSSDDKLLLTLRSS